MDNANIMNRRILQVLGETFHPMRIDAIAAGASVEGTHYSLQEISLGLGELRLAGKVLRVSLLCWSRRTSPADWAAWISVILDSYQDGKVPLADARDALQHWLSQIIYHGTATAGVWQELAAQVLEVFILRHETDDAVKSTLWAGEHHNILARAGQCIVSPDLAAALLVRIREVQGRHPEDSMLRSLVTTLEGRIPKPLPGVRVRDVM